MAQCPPDVMIVAPAPDGGFVVTDRLFEWLMDLADEDSRPLTDMFAFVAATSDVPFPPGEVVDRALAWLHTLRDLGWVTPVDSTYPHTFETDWAGALAWVELNRPALGAGKLQDTWPAPELDATEAYRALLTADRVQPEGGRAWKPRARGATWYGEGA